jgi:hypothetical protein
MLLSFIVFVCWLDVLAKYVAVKSVWKSWLCMFAGCLCSIAGCAGQAGRLFCPANLVFYAVWLCKLLFLLDMLVPLLGSAGYAGSLGYLDMLAKLAMYAG